jgi:hypothetical protein
MRVSARAFPKAKAATTLAIVAILAFVIFNLVSKGNAYDGPTCKPHSPACVQVTSSAAGGSAWIPAWYYDGLFDAQDAARLGVSPAAVPSAARSSQSQPSLTGKQPTAAVEERYGATRGTANYQQSEQQNYVSSQDQTVQARRDAARGYNPVSGND